MRTLDACHDATSVHGPTVGPIVPQSDETMEHELRCWLPTRLQLFQLRNPNGTHVSARHIERLVPEG